jgi:hypothetical protein
VTQYLDNYFFISETTTEEQANLQGVLIMGSPRLIKASRKPGFYTLAPSNLLAPKILRCLLDFFGKISVPLV